MKNSLPIDRKAASLIGHEALALGSAHFETR